MALLFSFYHEFTECEAKEMPNQLQNDRFRTYDQQIDILKNQKGLIISDETITKESLINIGYFSLIGGYKYPFKNPMTRKYINTTFEDIYALYKFDRELRELTFKYLCEVEMKIRQVMADSPHPHETDRLCGQKGAKSPVLKKVRMIPCSVLQLQQITLLCCQIAYGILRLL